MVESGSAHPLENTWTFWEHRKGDGGGDAYGSNMHRLGDVSTVEDFWRFKNNIPVPSKVFFTSQGGHKRFADREVEGYSLFKKGIRPEWEDKANMHGGEFCCRRGFKPSELDTLFERLLLGLIGETIDPADEICGMRVVDKSKASPLYRLEVWFRDQDLEKREVLRENIKNCIGSDCMKDYREHGVAMYTNTRGGGQSHHGPKHGHGGFNRR